MADPNDLYTGALRARAPARMLRLQVQRDKYRAKLADLEALPEGERNHRHDADVEKARRLVAQSQEGLDRIRAAGGIERRSDRPVGTIATAPHIVLKGGN